jgi:hypothetical protein
MARLSLIVLKKRIKKQWIHQFGSNKCFLKVIFFINWRKI